MLGRLKEREEEIPLWLGALIVFSLQVLILYPARDIYLSFQDEGNLITGASRMLDGQLPFRDYTSRFMPGTFAVLALGFRIFGEHIWVSRLYFLISLGLLAVTIWLFSRRLLPYRWSFLPVVMFYCVGGHFWPMAGYHWDATIFALPALLLASWKSEEPKEEIKMLFGAGILAGLVVVFLQPRGVAICLATGAMALYSAPRFKRVAVLVAGAAIPGVFFVGWMLAYNIFTPFWNQAVMYNLTVYSETQNFPFEWTLSWQQFKGILGGLAQFGQPALTTWLLWFVKALAFALVDLFKYTLFLPVLALGLAAFRKIEDESTRHLWLGLLIFLGLSVFLTWARATRYHFNFHTPAYYPLFVTLLYQFHQHYKVAARAIMSVVFGAFLIHGIDNYVGWYDYRYPIQFRRGTLYSNLPGFSQLTQGLANSINRRFDGQNLYGVPDFSLLVWLSGAKNPTSYDVLIPYLYPDEDFKRARSELEASGKTGILFRSLAGSLRDYPNVDPAVYREHEERQIGELVEGAQLLESKGGYYLFELNLEEQPG